MFRKTVWESSLPQRQCLEALQRALEGPHDWEDVRGAAYGNCFRLKVLTRPRFWRRGRLQYTLYGAITEDGNGRTRITARRLILLMLCIRPELQNLRELPFRAGLALLCCVLAAGADAAGYLFRMEESDRLRTALDNFLRDVLSARETDP